MSRISENGTRRIQQAGSIKVFPQEDSGIAITNFEALRRPPGRYRVAQDPKEASFVRPKTRISTQLRPPNLLLSILWAHISFH